MNVEKTTNLIQNTTNAHDTLDDTHEPKCAKTTTTPMGSLDQNDHLLATLTKEYFGPNLTVPKYFLYADQMVYLF